MSKAWKALERATAATLKGKRHLRRHRGEEGPDVDLPEDSPLRAFGVEAKYRKRLPSLLLLGLAQAAKASPEGLGLLVLKGRGMHGALACLRLEDLARLLCPSKGLESPEAEG